MLDFFVAREKMLAGAALLGTESVAVADANRRVLAETIVASTALPPFDYSAMDGYALRLADLSQAEPWELPVRGEARAGSETATLPEKACLRIFTGAPIPNGADCVVIQEDTVRTGESARFRERPTAFANIRRSGEDLALGAVALEPGTRLGPFHLGLAAALDRAELRVAKRPRVAIIATGWELRAPGSPARPGSIPESNSVALAALARETGVDVEVLPSVGDDRERATAVFDEALKRVDLLVTIGGVSVGDHDIVRPALEAASVTLEFWKVAIRPGKPITLGRRGAAWVLGLPGNPVSAQLMFSLFGIPLLRALQGDRRPVPESSRFKLGAPVRQKTGRMGCYRVRLERGVAWPFGNQASGSTLSLAQADAIVFLPADVESCPAGGELSGLRLAEL